MISLPDSLPVLTRPEVRGPLLEGRLSPLQCPTCAARVRLDLDLTYSDPIRRQYLLVKPSKALVQWKSVESSLPPLLHIAIGHYVTHTTVRRPLLRLVFGLEQFREKLLLWEYGLDDRLVEVAKLQMLFDPAMNLREEQRIHLLLSQVDLVTDRLWFRAERLTAPFAPQTVYIGLDLYRDLLSRQATLRSGYSKLFDHVFVSALRWFIPS